MDSLEFNKIAGAVLGTVFVLFGGSLLAEGIFHGEPPETPGYEIVVAEAAAGGGEAAPAVEPIAVRMQTADATAGQTIFRRCAACHNADPGGPNGIGPNLYEVVNRPIASHAGFNYSAGMTEFSQGQSVPWDYEHLDYFIEAPKAHVPGTAMGFAGLQDPKDRADLIGYLRSLAPNPAPLPEVTAEAAAPAEGAPPVTDPATTTDTAEGSVPNAQSPGTTDSATGAAPTAPAGNVVPQGTDGASPAEAAPAPAQPTGGDTTAAGSEGQAAPGAALPPAQPQPAAPAPAATTPPPASPAAPAPAAPAPAAPAPAAPAADPASAPAAPAAPAAQQTAAVAGDPKAGATVFNKCKACHAVGPGAANKIGPELNGIVGEAVAAVEGYQFSPAMTAFAQTHPTWDVATLTPWLTNPRQTVPGTKMAFPGLNKPADVANVIAYLATFAEDGSTR